jgi:hypothetical protein
VAPDVIPFLSCDTVPPLRENWSDRSWEHLCNEILDHVDGLSLREVELDVEMGR